MQEAAFKPTPPTKAAVARTFQFSIKTLLIATTVVAVFFAMAIFPPFAVITLLIAYTAIIFACIVTAFSGRGWIRPFAISSGMYLLVAALVLMNSHFPGPFAVFMLLLINLAIAIFIGLCAATTHSFLTRRGGMVPVPNIPFLRNWLHNEPIDLK